jgi:hypothetical protein
MDIPGELIPIVLFICGAATLIFTPIAKAYARNLDRKGQAGSLSAGDVQARLERMEHTIDSIAVEIERVSEGQRFTTRLLS